MRRWRPAILSYPSFCPKFTSVFTGATGRKDGGPATVPFEVIVGAILTQSTAWTNVEKALAAMKAAGCWSFERISVIPESELAAIIRSSGYYNAKARKLQAFANHVMAGGGLERLLRQDVPPA